MQGSSVRILGAFVDTLYLNVYQTNTSYQPMKKGIPDALKLELQQLKDLAAVMCTGALFL